MKHWKTAPADRRIQHKRKNDITHQLVVNRNGHQSVCSVVLFFSVDCQIHLWAGAAFLDVIYHFIIAFYWCTFHTYGRLVRCNVSTDRWNDVTLGMCCGPQRMQKEETVGHRTLLCVGYTSAVQCKRTVVLRSVKMRNFLAAQCGKSIRGNLRNVPHSIFHILPLDNFPHSTKYPRPVQTELLDCRSVKCCWAQDFAKNVPQMGRYWGSGGKGQAPTGNGATIELVTRWSRHTENSSHGELVTNFATDTVKSSHSELITVKSSPRKTVKSSHGELVTKKWNHHIVSASQRI